MTDAAPVTKIATYLPISDQHLADARMMQDLWREATDRALQALALPGPEPLAHLHPSAQCRAGDRHLQRGPRPPLRSVVGAA